MIASHRTASVETPLSLSDDPTAVKIEEIPLPPPELWAELDNSASTQPTQAASTPVTAREIAKLDFSAAMEQVIPLLFPFSHETTGYVDSITVRRLTVGEVGEIIDTRSVDAPDNFDLYARLTGVPAPVLRGLEASDGEEVSRVCYDFLPRIFQRRAHAPSSS